jgi:tRNA nucleotidyltransferase (CCA-adding enzyme)
VSGTHAIHGAQEVIGRLASLPGGPELLAQARRREDIALVGGAVRDLLLGHWPRELDVTVAGDSAPLARALSASVSPSERPYGHVVEPILHERFSTASVVWDYGRIDIAELRAESYPAPGALPDVRSGSVEEDLARRDFTVNAISLPLGGARRGELIAVEGALEDLQQGRLRVLHEQSFRDDPTRLLRLARYAARLGFEVETRTAELARAALAERALDTVSGARIGAELRLALGEADALATLAAMNELGLLHALHPRLRCEQPVLEATLALLPADGRPDLALLAALVLPLALRAEDDRSEIGQRAEIVALLDRWDFPAGDRDRVVAATVAVPRLIEELPAAERPSRLRAAAAGVPLEGVALAGALGARESAGRWLEDVRHIRLQIDGADLIAAGISEGPEIGQRLEAVLKLRLDGELADGREAELQAALDRPTPAENGAGGPS